MKIQLKTTIAALGALLFCAAPAVANAERVYFLVGTRHIFRIGTSQYAAVDQRMKIEQDYADQIAADQDTFNKAVQDGADPNQESVNLNSALNDLSNERDKELGALYENVDYERTRHPELQIQGDGPYQVMAIDFHWRGDFEVFDNFYVYAPWPGYVVVGHPYGWTYGIAYSPFAFHHAYVGWYGGYVSMGSPAFVGIVGTSGPVAFSIGINIGGGGGGGGFVFHRDWAARGPGYTHSAYFHGNGPLATRSVNRVIGNGGGNRFQPGGPRPGGPGGTAGSRYNRGGSMSPDGLHGGSTTGSRYNRGGGVPGSTGRSAGSHNDRGPGSAGATGSTGSRYSHGFGGSTGSGGTSGTSSSSRGGSSSFGRSGSGSTGGSTGSTGSRYSHSTGSSSSTSKSSHSGDSSKGNGGHSNNDNKDKGKGG